MQEDLNNRIENYSKALKKLNEINTYPMLDDIVKTAFVQRFNFTFEQSIKVIKELIINLGENSDIFKGSKDVIRTALQLNIIENGETWFEMIKDRNIIAHEYNEMKIDEIYLRIKNNYLQEFNKLKTYADTIQSQSK